jgi:cell division protein FtsI (penicillin-binding protein 3)
MKAATLQLRIVSVASVFLSLLLIALVRAFHLCVIDGSMLRGRAANQHLQNLALPPERGAIVDRHGDLLALTVESSAVFLRPARFDRRQAGVVARTLDLPADLVAAKAASTEKFVWLRRNATPEQAAALSALGLGGVGSEPSHRRIYPHGGLGGQVLGSVGIDLQGLGGVELAYDDLLRGEAEALRFERDARGRRFLRDGADQPRHRSGARVELTIDAALQQVAETELEAAVASARAAAGSAIVMDPQSGEILALAHFPRFDPSARGAAASDLARNRVISDTYEPGSTFKSIVAAAALEAGVVRPDERLYCEGGSYVVGKRVVHDHENYGWLTFADVIKHSSNICTAKVGERLGGERLSQALRGFGFGEVTRIDLAGEKTHALVPWQRWARINLVTTSFGQGIAVTPIQLVRAYAALANGGKLMRPYIVRRILADDDTVLKENRPEVVGQPISARTAAAMTQILRGVVESGTGTKAGVEGIAVAGKTGTAQKVDPATGHYSARDRISSFIGYLPAEEPRYVILVIIDTPRTATYGGLVAAPAFRRIAEYGADRLGLRVATAPAPIPEAATAKVSLVSWVRGDLRSGMPSFLGLSMREALKQAQRAGWQVRVQGSGFVSAQEPPPGAENAEGRILHLQFGSAAG